MNVTRSTSTQRRRLTIATPVRRRRRQSAATMRPYRTRRTIVRTRTAAHRRLPSATRLRFQVHYENGLNINLQIGRRWLFVLISIMVATGLTQIAPVLKVL
jgi:hypothetical protein